MGCAHGPGGAHDPGLTLPETRTHFYAWVIVSSPLTLSHNVNDPVISEKVWPIISNKDVIEISQTWIENASQPTGRLIKSGKRRTSQRLLRRAASASWCVLICFRRLFQIC